MHPISKWIWSVGERSEISHLQWLLVCCLLNLYWNKFVWRVGERKGVLMRFPIQTSVLNSSGFIWSAGGRIGQFTLEDICNVGILWFTLEMRHQVHFRKTLLFLVFYLNGTWSNTIFLRLRYWIAISSLMLVFKHPIPVAMSYNFKAKANCFFPKWNWKLGDTW